MSAREWKPGDVAIIRPEGAEYEVLGLRDENGWAHLREYTSSVGARSRWTSAGLVTVVRPLVVIDPENREQTSRLAAELQRRDVYHDNDATLAQVLSLALHALVTPPEPPEPSCLGALVEAKFRDSEGAGFGPCAWAKAGDGSWVCLTDGLSRTAVSWPFLVDVRVLSEGVTA